jgi:hypothetical protein
MFFIPDKNVKKERFFIKKKWNVTDAGVIVEMLP